VGFELPPSLIFPSRTRKRQRVSEPELRESLGRLHRRPSG
jgi:hypothetical protein